MSKKNRDNLFGWLDFGTGIAGVAANVLSTILTNKKNQEIAREQNALQVRESEKAYERGKPINQVAQMQAAGMSKAGALNAINGGATYQPAPMTSAQAQAPQIDLSTAFDGLMQIGENAKQRKLQEDLQEQQIKAAKQAQEAQFEENEKQRKHDALMKDVDTANQTQHDYLEYEKHKEQLEFDKQVYKDAAPLRRKQLEELDARIKGLNATTNNTKVQTALLDLQYELDAENLDVKKIRNLAVDLADISNAQLSSLRDSLSYNAITSMDEKELNLYLQYKARLELVAFLSSAIKEEQWTKPNQENKLKLLRFLEYFLVKR